jgi:hypothetical protein
MRTLDSLDRTLFDARRAKHRASRPTLPPPGRGAGGATWAAWKAALDERHQENRRLRRAHPDVVLHACLMNEVDYVQFTGRLDDQGKPIRVHFWQAPLLLDNIVVAFCGRDVGKSSSMKWCLEQRATNYFTSGCILTGNQDWRISKPWKELVMDTMPNHWWAKQFLDKRDGASSSRNPYHQWFLTGYKIYGIPAGENTAHKVESPHFHSLCADEFQEYSYAAWEALIPSVNAYGPNVGYGAMRKVFGVNKEGRIDTPFYDLAFRHANYRCHRYQLPSWYNPTYDRERHSEFLANYDFSIHATKFKQYVRGQVGEREQGLIDQHAWNACCLIGRSLGLIQRRQIRIDKAVWSRAVGEIDRMMKDGDLTPCPFAEGSDGRIDPSERGRYEEVPGMTVLSMDYGSTAPSELGIWVAVINPEVATEDNRIVWALWQRITMEGIEGHDQAAVVDYLMDFFGCHYGSIDSTAATNVVAQILTDPRHGFYVEKEYPRRIYAAASNRYVIIRYQDTEPPDRTLAPAGMRWRHLELSGQGGFYRMKVWALEQHANVHASNTVAELVSHRTLAIPNGDGELQGELLGVVEKIQPGIQPKYVGPAGATGLHRFSMLRSFAQWIHYHYTLRKLKREILGEEEEGSWSQGTGMLAFSRVRVPASQREPEPVAI